MGAVAARWAEAARPTTAADARREAVDAPTAAADGSTPAPRGCRPASPGLKRVANSPHAACLGGAQHGTQYMRKHVRVLVTVYMCHSESRGLKPADLRLSFLLDFCRRNLFAHSRRRKLLKAAAEAPEAVGQRGRLLHKRLAIDKNDVAASPQRV